MSLLSEVGHLAKVCLSKLRTKNVHEIEASSSSNALPNSGSTQPISDYVFLGPIEATPLSMNVHSISCREKALLEVSLSLGPEGRQVNALCKIDSGAETNILPKSLYQQLNPERMGLAQSTMRLSAYGGVEIPNLGSCQIYVKGPNNPSPKPIQAEVVDVDGPAIIGNMSAQNLKLLKLNWPITANQYSDDLTTPRGTPTPQVNHTRPTHDLHTVRLFDMGGKQHPFPLTKDYLLKEYEDVFTGIGCFPGAPYHIETDPEVPPVQHALRQVPVQLQQAYMEELDQLKKWGILSEVRNEYTPWVNSTVVTIKPNRSIRLCLDPRNLNKAVKRNPYYVR